MIELAKVRYGDVPTFYEQLKVASKQSHFKSLELLRFAGHLPIQYQGSELCFRSLRVPAAVEQRESCQYCGTIKQPLCGGANAFHNQRPIVLSVQPTCQRCDDIDVLRDERCTRCGLGSRK